MGTRAMTTVVRGTEGVTPRVSERWRTWRWVLLALIVIAAVAAVTTYLTAPRPGGRMDPASTSSEGAHALVALLRDHGVDVVVAPTVADVERAARPDTLLLIAQNYYRVGDDLMQRLAATPGDRLVVEPLSRTRAALASKIRTAPTNRVGDEPNCTLPAANRAGSARLEFSDTYEAATEIPVIRCYDGAL